MGAAQRKKITAAWHEAGHIVVGTHFNLRLTQASIIPLRAGSGISYDEMVNQAMPETVRVLNEHWSEVEAIAALLLKHTIVTPELLSRIRSPEESSDCPQALQKIE